MKPVLLVTGGARGIGRAIVAEFLKDHAVAATYHTTEPDDAQDATADLLMIQADLSFPEAARTVIDRTIARFGRLDVIINNAGAIKTDAQDQGENHSINLLAPMALLDAALPHLASGASIINISSVNAVFPAMGALSYSASKAALNTWTSGIAKTLGPRGIRVNGIAPGAIETIDSPRPASQVKAFVEMTALGRIGVPQDIAKVARFLASEAAGFITGETLTVSGGYRL
ncbi:SDR family oxidoreductase [Sulfitobacter sp. F26204]|uniref:SDR family NAD(P)-dependent oxidoreductase n=1 Tax=Sulfitobacter sp. F26204 TaxID=2996014 RepID=UPI00225E3601|nr:SDR family oxidoreductase [Sulfitobacter sp. F26204]MCX7560795.1 SDR family oxidoreductase [Sulfitobacter sp. F26204]